MLIGVILRAKVPIFRKYLIPSCILGGVIAMICNLTGLMPSGLLGVHQPFIATLTFHLFGLFYGAVALTVSESDVNEPKSKSLSKGSRNFLWGALWIIGIQNFVSAFMGVSLGGSMLAVNVVFGTDYVGSTAVLLTSGFIVGPVSAMSMGLVWDTVLADGRNFAGLGLTCGSLGFLFAYILGVPLANYYHRKRACEKSVDCFTDEAEQRGYYGAQDASEAPSLGKETTHAGNIDTFAVQFGIVFFVYLLAIFVGLFCVHLLGDNPLAGVVWSLFFMFPIFTGILVRILLKKFGFLHLINQRINDRIKGSLIDFIVMCSFFAIILQNISAYAIFLVIGIPMLCSAIIVVAWFMGKVINNYKDERVLFLTGLMTGTAATGLFLARIIDPDGKSPIPFEVGYTPVIALLFALPFAPFGHWEILYGNSFLSWAGLNLGMALLFLGIVVLSTWKLNKIYKKT